MTKEDFIFQCQLIIGGTLAGFSMARPIEPKDVPSIVMDLIMPKIEKALTKVDEQEWTR